MNTLREEAIWEDIAVDERFIIERIVGKWWEGMDWILLTQDRDQWQALVNMAMEFLD
jgi:hypothetical protein